jgi:hypothetical protein
MANLIIKSSADNLVLQGSDASPALTVAADGQTTFAENATLSGTLGVTGNTTLSGTANNLGTVTAGNINVGSVAMKSSDGSVTAMACDTTGRITQPAKPCFLAQINTGDAGIGAGAKVPFNYEHFDVGGNYNNSTYIYTIPVSGYWHFENQVYSNHSGTNLFITLMKKGSVTLGQSRFNLPQDTTISFSVFNYFAVNDEVFCVASNGSTYNYYGSSANTLDHTWFSGYLVS